MLLSWETDLDTHKNLVKRLYKEEIVKIKWKYT